MLNNLYIGLKGYNPHRTDYGKRLDIYVELKSALEPKRCPRCFCSRIRSKGSYLRKTRHLESFRQPSVLHIHTRRFQCTRCPWWTDRD